MRCPLKHQVCALLVVLADGGALLLCSCRGTDADDSAPKSMVLSYADLDLADPAATDALYERINRAATAVCRAERRQEIEAQRCINVTVSHAVAEIDAPLLTAKHRAAHATP